MPNEPDRTPARPIGNMNQSCSTDVLRRDFIRAFGIGSMSLVASTALRQTVATEPLQPVTDRHQAIGKNVVATVNPLATEAAIDVYRAGGNAIDAAVAAAGVLGVVDSHNSGFGGGCLALIRTSMGELHAIDGRETAPTLASETMFLENGKPEVTRSQLGAKAVATPGQVAAMYEMSRRFGTQSWSRLLEPSITLASQGFSIDGALASRIREEAQFIARFPATAKQFLRTDGKPYKVGEKLVQSDLARSLESLSKEGPDWFYRGPFARQVGAWMAENKGLLSADDFAKYEVRYRTPIKSSYREHEIVGFPPPSSGGVHVAQMLNMLEHFPVRDLFTSEPSTAVHLLLEVMKLAFADRAHWLGDSDFVDVPRGLLDVDYASKLAKLIKLDRATRVAGHGEPDPSLGVLRDERKHTTHLTTADAQGNWVAMTCTINTSFGSKVIVPGSGIVLNNQMDDFSIAPGIPNAFGLVGARANAVGPGKRPLSSMSPTIVLDATGSPIFSAGAAGGPKIISAVLQSVIASIDLRLSTVEALTAPRVHHQWRPDEALLENGFSGKIEADLRSMGHQIKRSTGVAVAQAIRKLPDGTYEAAGEPRNSSASAGTV